MKKKFQIFLVFFLTYAFICCPVFARSSFADSNTNDGSSTAPTAKFTGRIGSIKDTVASIKESIPGWIEELKTLNIPPTSSDEMKTNQGIRKAIAQDILTKLGINRAK